MEQKENKKKRVNMWHWNQPEQGMSIEVANSWWMNSACRSRKHRLTRRWQSYCVEARGDLF